MRRTELRAWLAGTALGLALSVAPALAASGFDLPQLAALLATRKSGEASFTEERFVSGFDGPLQAKGRLSFAAPDRFARHTTEPRDESMVVEGDSIVIKRGGRSRQMALDAAPELSALVAAMRGTLMGDSPTLLKHFFVRVEGVPARWTMTLKPRDARLANQVREIKIVGLLSEVRVVELWLGGGDRSVMAIDPSQTATR